MKRFLLLLLAFVIVLASLLFVLKYQLQIDQEIMPPNDVQMPTTYEETYRSEDNEVATVQYDNTNSRAYVTHHSSVFAYDFDAVELLATTSDSGVKYENTELGLTLFEKSGDITLYENDVLIFESVPQMTTLSEEEAIRYLSDRVWRWHETVLPSGELVTPNKTGAFTLTFATDRTMKGATDCNGFSGTYSVSNWQLTFGSMMSTLMFCEDSQETEFTNALSDMESFAFNKEGNLILTLGQEQGSMTFIAQQE